MARPTNGESRSSAQDSYPEGPPDAEGASSLAEVFDWLVRAPGPARRQYIFPAKAGHVHVQINQDTECLSACRIEPLFIG